METLDKSIMPGCALLAAPADFKHAAEQIGISHNQKNVAAVLLAPTSGP